MSGIVYILASAPWGPVRIGAAPNMSDLFARGIRPVLHVEVAGRDPHQVVAIARSRLPAINALGSIPVNAGRAFQAIREALSAVPAVVVAAKPENPASDSPCEPAGRSEGWGEVVVPNSVRVASVARLRRQAAIELDVREIRAGTKMTQAEFAKAFGITVATVRDWEQGRTMPDAAARSLLMVIEHRPDVVREALGRYGVPVEA